MAVKKIPKSNVLEWTARQIKERGLWIEEVYAVLQSVYFAVAGWNDEKKYTGFKGHTFYLCLIKNGHYTEITFEGDKTSALMRLIKKYNSDKNFVDRLIKEWQEMVNEHNKLLKEEHKNLSDKELCKFYMDLQNNLTETSKVTWIVEFFDVYTNKELLPKLKKLNPSIPENKISEAIIILSIPIEKTFFNEEREKLLRLSLMYLRLNKKPDDEFEEELKRHTARFYWININYSNIYSLKKQYFLKRIKKFSEKGERYIKEELNDINSYYKKIREDKIKLRKSLKLNKELSAVFELLEKMGLFQDKRKKNINKMIEKIFNVLEEISRRKKCSRRLLEWATPDEITKLILKNKKIDRNRINSRKKCMALLKCKYGFFLIEGAEAKKLYSTFKSRKNTGSIKGFVAYSNNKLIRGTVQIILDPKKDKFKEGSILVASMTRPDYLPFMAKAKAIITNEGGLTCHAAIISRELRIPCIIGTKIATKVLKDGDLVEVDADNGIVRKITGKKQKTLIKTKKNANIKMKPKKIKHPIGYREENIMWFNELNKKDIPFVGGKGANLGEMFYHFPVPNGFCVTVNAYNDFMDTTMIRGHIHGLLDKLDIRDNEQLEKTSEKIRELILKQEFPKELKEEIVKNYHKLKNKKIAVRSSATAEDLPDASFAGQQDTYLNVEGDRKLIEAVQKCWASLFTSRAIYYREQYNFKHRDVLISVVIQEMIDPEHAGVIFTVDPVNKKYILIEIVEGLGEQLVSGEVTPNTYFINKITHKLEEKSEHFDFDKKMLKEISKIGEKIEEHYKKPQDIEFAIDKKGNLFIVQSRPITTL